MGRSLTKNCLIGLFAVGILLVGSWSAKAQDERPLRESNDVRISEAGLGLIRSGGRIPVFVIPPDSEGLPDQISTRDLELVRQGHQDNRNRFLGDLSEQLPNLLDREIQQDSEGQTFITFRYSNAFEILANEEEIIAFIDAGARVSEARLHQPQLSDSVPIISADQMHAIGITGNSSIAIIDTGVDSNHRAFTGRIVRSVCFSSQFQGRGETLCPNGEDIDLESAGAGDPCPANISSCDHGTHVAGIAASNFGEIGVAPGARIIAIQVGGIYGEEECKPRPSCVLFNPTDYLRALDYLIDNHVELELSSINMSIGSDGEEHSEDCSLNNAASTQIRHLRQIGVATVIASGNDRFNDAVASPACIGSAITVGATNDLDELWRGLFGLFFGGSNSSELVDLLAPGREIRSAVPGGGFAANTGTSMAAPHVAGAIALLRHAFPNASVDQIENALESTGVTVVHPVSNLQRQRIDVHEAYEHLLSAIGQHSLTVQLVGSGSITADGVPLDCGSEACSESFGHGRQVVLRPQSQAGWVFESWSYLECAEGSRVSRTCTIYFDRDREVTATFVRDQNHISTTSLIGPRNGVEVGTQPSMLWREASNANRYFVVVSEDPNTIQNIVSNAIGSCPESNCIISASFSGTAFAPYALDQACNYPSPSPSGRMQQLEPGRTYYWAVQPFRRNSCSDTDDGPWSEIASFRTLAGSSPPGNDDFADAAPIGGLSQTIPFSNVGATQESSEPLHPSGPGGSSVWWRWTSPANAGVEISVTEASFEAQWSIFRGTPTNPLVMLWATDNWSDERPSILLEADAGEVFYIRVDGRNGATGTGSLQFSTPTSIRYPLGLSISGAGTIHGYPCPSGECTFLENAGDAIALTAAPEPGAEFRGWGGDCAAFATLTNCTFQMNGPHSVTARFAATTDQTGSITTYLYPQLAIQAGAAWRLSGETSWRTSGTSVTGVTLGQSVIEFRDVSGWVPPDDFVLTLTDGARSRELHLDYVRPEKSLIVDFSGDGWGEITVPGPVTCSESCTVPMGDTSVTRVQAYPGAGSLFGGWSGDCVDLSEVEGAYWCDVDFRTRAGDHTVGAQFDVNPEADRLSITIELRAFDGLGRGRMTSSTHPEINCTDRCTYEVIEGEPFNLRLELEDSVLVRYYDTRQAYALWFINDGYDQNPQPNDDRTMVFDLAADTSRWVQTWAESDGQGRILPFPRLRWSSTRRIGETCQPEFYSCSDVVPAGQSFDVLANPAAGWAVYEWAGALSGRCSRDQNPCSITIDDSADQFFLDAIFTPIISVAAIGTGSGRIIGGPARLDCITDTCRSEIIDCGDRCVEIAEPFGPSIAFYAFPDEGSEFVRWNYDCGSGVDPDACYAHAGNPVHVEAEFSRIAVNNTLTVARSGTGTGSISSSPSGIDCGATCQADFADTDTVVLTAAAQTGSVFAGWNGDCESTSGNTCNVEMASDRSVSAAFNIEQITLDYHARGQGSGSVTSNPVGMDCSDDCSMDVDPGSITWTASPAEGSVFGGWGGICSGEELTCQRTLTANSELWARFNLAAPPTSNIVSSIVPQSRGGPSGGTLTAFVGVTNAGDEIATECRPALRTEAGIDFSFVAIDGDQSGNPIAPDEFPIDVPPNRGNPQQFLVRFTAADPVGPIEARVMVLCANSTTRFTPSVNTIILTFQATPPADIVANMSTATNNGRVTIPTERNNGALAAAAINVTGRDFGIPATIRIVPNTSNIPLGVALEICQTDENAICLTSSPLSSSIDVEMGANPVLIKVVLRRVPGAGVPFIPAFIRGVLDFYQVDETGNVNPETGLRGRTSVGLDVSAPPGETGIDGLWFGIARLLDDPDDVPSPIILAMEDGRAWMFVDDGAEQGAEGTINFPDGGFTLALTRGDGAPVGVGGVFIPHHQILADSFELRQTNLRFAYVDPRIGAPLMPTGTLTATRYDLASRAYDAADTMALSRLGNSTTYTGQYQGCIASLSFDGWTDERLNPASLALSSCAQSGTYGAIILPLRAFSDDEGILILVWGTGLTGGWAIRSAN